MSQRVNNPTMPGVPSRTESEESRSVDGNQNKDDLSLFTRGQVFTKSSRRPTVPLKSLSYPGTSTSVLRHSAQSYASYSDSGFSTPGQTLLSFTGQQDGFPSYSSHGNSHGYHSASSTPGLPPPSVPPLDLFPFDSSDQVSMYGSTTNGATTVGGADSTGSTSWLQQFGLQDGPAIGFGPR